MNHEIETGFSIFLVEELRADGSVVWTALHPELQGCNGTGFSQPEALANLNKSREAWLSVAGKTGTPIPVPAGEPVITTIFSPARGANMMTTTGQEMLTEVKQLVAA